MRKLLAAAIMFAVFTTTAGAQVKMPAASPVQTIKQDFGTASIELTYSRPSLKGRKILGDQDPWDKVWRTGANGATRIKLNEPVMMGGKQIDTGTYVLYTIPSQKGDWTVIINRGLTNWGTDGYKESEDVARFTVSPMRKLKQKTETFTIQFTDIKAESCNLAIMWDKWALYIPITVNLKDKLRSQIETALQGEKKPYWQAAGFYYEWDKNYPKALENVNKAIEGNAKGFWMYLLKAKVLKEMGQKAEALAAAEKCVELATEAKNDAYIKQGSDIVKELK
jgi:hypothetical protein